MGEYLWYDPISFIALPMMETTTVKQSDPSTSALDIFLPHDIKLHIVRELYNDGVLPGTMLDNADLVSPLTEDEIIR